jgi:hypothetical protein
MKWIDEMFADMKMERAAASARSANGSKVNRTEHLKSKSPAH